MSITDFYEALMEAIKDGGAGARQWVENEAKNGDGLEVIFPCYAALATWKSGLGSIVNLALRGSTAKSKSAALTTLTFLASSGQVSTHAFFLHSEELVECINKRLDSPALKPEAKQVLRTLVLSIPIDDLLIPISQTWFHLQIHPDPVAPRELIGALGARWFHISPTVLDRYERMFAECANDEPAFQTFFCTYPQLLDPMAVQVWSQPDFHGAAEPDFVIRRADNSYLVVEIECPSKPLMTKNGQLTHEAVRAEKQALDYESFLSKRFTEAQRHFPEYRRADCLAIIGLEHGLTADQRKNLDRGNSRRQNMKIAGFDWLLHRARAVVTNVGEPNVEVIRRYRVL